MTINLPPRRAVLQGLASLPVAGATQARCAEAVPASFIAVGDWGREGGRSQRPVAAAMGDAAAALASRFVLSAGDNFYPAGVTSVADRQWRASFEDIYTAASLQIPWYAALGNHDYRGDPAAQVEYAATNARWRMSERYFSCRPEGTETQDLELFVLDTTPIVGGYGEALERFSKGRVRMPDPRPQVEWLRSALSRSTARWKVVVGHHPIHSGGHHGGSAVLAALVEPLLQTHGVQAYIAGHDHSLQHVRVGRTDHICTGAGSSFGPADDISGTLFRRSEPGFAVFTMGAEAMRLQFRTADGRVVYEGLVPRRA